MSEDEEREATIFAYQLLMPEAWIRRDLEGKALDQVSDKTVTRLALRYQVPTMAMTIRLAQLGYFGPGGNL